MPKPKRIDYLTREGAYFLVNEIMAYWYRRGYEVNPRVEHVEQKNAEGYFVVRSDMVGGLPRKPGNFTPTLSPNV